MPAVDPEKVRALYQWWLDVCKVRRAHPACKGHYGIIWQRDCCDIHRAIGAAWGSLHDAAAGILDTEAWYSSPDQHLRNMSCEVLSGQWWGYVGMAFEETRR